MDFEQLKRLTTLKYQHSQKALSDILKRENELRSELDRMRLLVLKTQSQDPEDAHLRSIGGDIIWLKWVGKVQRELNTSLASVLAQKEALMGKHMREAGRKVVAETLVEQEHMTRFRKTSKAKLESAINSSLYNLRG